MKKIIYLLALLSFPTIADWQYINTTDDFTDESIEYVLFEDNEHRLEVRKSSTPENSTWLFITMKGLGTFEPYAPVDIRVDKNKSYSVDKKQSEFSKRWLNFPLYVWEPQTIGILLGAEHKKGEVNFCNQLDYIGSGKNLKFRYHTSKLKSQSYSVSLSGAQNALSKLVNLTSCTEKQI